VQLAIIRRSLPIDTSIQWGAAVGAINTKDIDIDIGRELVICLAYTTINMDTDTQLSRNDPERNTKYAFG